MSLTSRRVPSVLPTRAARIPARLATALLLLLGLVLTATACGMYVQTNRPYTPADGVNVDTGTVRVRNLMILAKGDGTGFLSSSLTSTMKDTLTGVSGNPIKPDGSLGPKFTATMPAPVPLTNGVLVVLTNQPLITVTSPDLAPGLTAKMVLQFSQAGPLTINVPVVDANQPDYATISPSPSASPSS